MEKHRNVSDTVHVHNFSLRGQIICLTLGHSAITATQAMQVKLHFTSLNSSQEISYTGSYKGNLHAVVNSQYTEYAVSHSVQ